MNFLAPLYLIGLAAIAGPIILHLIRRRTRQDQVFSSLMFLSPSPPKINRRSRIDNWLLLLARAAVVGLLALAFTRPFVSAAVDMPLSTAARTRIVVIDRSASMQREDLWRQAINKAKTAIYDLQTQDALALIVYDQTANVMLSLDATRDNNAKQTAIDTLKVIEEAGPSWNATQHWVALQAAVDEFEAFRSTDAWSAAMLSEVILISDLQSGNQFERLQTLQWPTELKLDLQPIASTSTSNASASILSTSPSRLREGRTQSGEGKSKQRIRIDNDEFSTSTKFKLTWTDASGTQSEQVPGEFEVSPGKSRVLSIDSPAFESGKLVLSGDQCDFGNESYFFEPKVAPKIIQYVSDRQLKEDSKDLGYFLKQISSPNAPDLPQVESSTSDNIVGGLMKAPSLVVVNSDVRAATSKVIREYVEGGGSLLIALDSLPTQVAEIDQWWKDVFGDESIAIAESSVDDFLLWQSIDFQHPVFAAFNDPKSNNFSHIHFWKARSITLSDIDAWRVLVSFDNQQPALLSRRIGTGNVYLLCSGWQVDDSQFALSTKFVPWLLQLMSTTGQPIATEAWTVGIAAPLDLGQIKSITAPDGTIADIPTRRASEENPIPARRASEGNQLPTNERFLPNQPGLYRCEFNDGSIQTYAANLDRNERQLTAISTDQFEQFGIDSGKMSNQQALVDAARQMRNSELEASQQWWRWLLVLGLAIVGLETVFSMKKAK
jgi:hypothetical protein